MLVTLNKLRELEKKLDEYQQKRSIIDFRIILRLNLVANLYIVLGKLSESALKRELSKTGLELDTIFITQDESESDAYYSSLFKNTKKFDMSLRRSLSYLIESPQPSNISSAPIITFYSYKGGVGRTTALAMFASYCAMHQGKKVFIIDCDFEAPGFTNFFGLGPLSRPKNGIVEYIKDKEALANITLNDDYVYSISKEYTGEGEINLFPAGNLSSEQDINDYLEALARLDIHSTTTIVDQLSSVFNDINDTYHPDIILLDSRTGFTDIFALTAVKFSTIVVGFFGNGYQTIPGIQFFLSTILKHFYTIKPIMVLSILSSSFSKQMEIFQTNFEEYILRNMPDVDSLPVIPSHYLSRYPSLEKIGTEEEDLADFITVVRNKAFNDYIKLFEEILNALDQVKITREPAAEACEPLPAKSDENKSLPSKMLQLKTTIITSLQANFPAPYGDYLPRDDPEFWSSRFYFRTAMEDIFNSEKFLLLGSKGTGKTAFYLALKQDDFFSKLLRRAQKHSIKFKCISVISMRGDSEQTFRFIDASSHFLPTSIKDPDFFYRRFWVVFIWNAIRLDADKIGYEASLHLNVRPVTDDADSANYLRNYINDKDVYPKIEKDLQLIDSWALQNDMHLLLTFDRLDEVIRPILWSDAIAPLISYCNSLRFKRIFPKLFIRRDLFNRLGNLTNKEALDRQAINLEWSREELYAFFFKIVFANSKAQYLEYAQSVKDLDHTTLDKISNTIKQTDSYNQLPPDEQVLRPLVEVFFGKYALSGKQARHYGDMYDWIYKNLQNADRTISLRPFLDLIKYAIQRQNSYSWLKDCGYPVIDPRSFNAEVRGRAVEGHIKDLSQEKGNEALNLIINDIRGDRVPVSLKFSSLSQPDFEELMKCIVQNNQDSPHLKDLSIIDLENILKLNGIVFIKYGQRGAKRYNFAYLYKYFLGLRSPAIFN